jgi:hypothetical protein
MKQSRLERIGDSTFARLNLEEQACQVGGTTVMYVTTFPVTDPIPHGHHDALDVVSDS